MIEIFEPNHNNYYFENPVQPGNQLWWGVGYPIEVFYKIDFYNIKKDMYIVSNYGRIFSLNTGKELKQIRGNNNDTNFYYSAQLRLEETEKDKYSNCRRLIGVHRLVAMAFIPKTPEDYFKQRDVVNHKNLLKWNNVSWNLEWVTESENKRHAYINNAYTPSYRIFKQVLTKEDIENNQGNWGAGSAKGEEVGVSRLTNEQAHIICQCLEQGKSHRECAETAGLVFDNSTSSIIVNIKAGRRWSHISNQYNINRNMKAQTDYSRYVIQVCELLEQGYKIKQIYEILNIPGENNYDKVRMFISGIKNKKNYTDISCNYNF